MSTGTHYTMQTGVTNTLTIIGGTAGLTGTWTTSNAGVVSISSAGPASSITATANALGTADVVLTYGSANMTYTLHITVEAADTIALQANPVAVNVT